MMSLIPILGFICFGFFILIFLVAGISLTYQSYRSRQKAKASQNWSSTAGQIVEAHVERQTATDSEGDRRVTYAPDVSYTYQVMGQDYTGKNIAFGFKQTFTREDKAQAALGRFPVGQQVTVYYDPANPSEAVLERIASGSKTSLVLGIVFLVLSVCLGCPGILYFVYSFFTISTSTTSP